MNLNEIFCKIGIHKYKYILIDEGLIDNWAIRFWQCCFCGKTNHKKNGQEFLLIEMQLSIQIIEKNELNIPHKNSCVVNMRIGLLDIDGHNFPNLALKKAYVI